MRRQAVRDDIVTVAVPANELAAELGNVKMANVVLLGAMLSQRPIVSLDAVETVLEEHRVGAKRRFIEPNKRALYRGATYTQAQAAGQREGGEA